MSEQYKKLEMAISEGDEAAGVAEALRLVESGLSPVALFTDCIESALAKIGDQFSRLEIFLPEMIASAGVVKAIQAAIQPYLAADQSVAKKGRVVIATVSGDLHDIGKNIVKVMLEVNGFEMKDLGVDVDARAAINAAKDFDANIIALSALMLPSLPFVKDVVDFVNANQDLRKRFKVIVGGGPVSKDWSDQAGVDGYGEDAIEAVDIANNLVGAA
jgi:methanogenic corrinoid protein MtbC1